MWRPGEAEAGDCAAAGWRSGGAPFALSSALGLVRATGATSEAFAARAVALKGIADRPLNGCRDWDRRRRLVGLEKEDGAVVVRRSPTLLGLVLLPTFHVPVLLLQQKQVAAHVTICCKPLPASLFRPVGNHHDERESLAGTASDF